MIDQYVVKALIEVSLFLEFADDQVVAPDAAVSAMEQLGANLQCVGGEQRRALVAQIQSLAPDYPEHEQFVRDLPEALGFADE